MGGNNILVKFIILTPLLLLSLSLHEFAHGKMADVLGDPTPGKTGRLTLNPLAHLSFLGTLVLFITMLSGWIIFGWAKPVQINPRYFKDEKRGMMLVGLAGPLTNITLAVTLGLIYNYFSSGLEQFVHSQVLILFFGLGVALNIGLAIFNLLPVPPLDGSKVLNGLLPDKLDYVMRNLEAYGPFFLLLLVFTGGIDIIFRPIFVFVLRLPIFKVLLLYLQS